MKRNATEDEKEVFGYLNELRETGEVNMFGARSYIMDEFDTGDKEAKRLLLLWMKNFNKEGNYDQVED